MADKNMTPEQLKKFLEDFDKKGHARNPNLPPTPKKPDPSFTERYNAMPADMSRLEALIRAARGR